MSRRSWSEEQLRNAVQESYSVRAVLKKLSLVPAGGNYVQIQQAIADYDIDRSHFKGSAWNKDLVGITSPRTPLNEVLCKGSRIQSFKLKARLFHANLKPRYCEQCGWSKIAEDGRLPLELDHINGDRYDNRLENLRILCPNCHSLQATHRGRNKKQARVVKW